MKKIQKFKQYCRACVLNFIPNFVVNGYTKLHKSITNVIFISFLLIFLLKYIYNGFLFNFLMLIEIEIYILNFKEHILNINFYDCQNKFFIVENADINIIKKKNENYKNIINNYICNYYYIFNNNSSYIKLLLNEYDIKLLLKKIVLNLEIVLIGLQKIIYEYINYITPLYNWYGNYKLLIDKNIVQINMENLYYNTSLDLLLDTIYANNESRMFIHFLDFNFNVDSKNLIYFLKKYNIDLKKKPYYMHYTLLRLLHNDEYLTGDWRLRIPQLEDMLTRGPLYILTNSKENKDIIDFLNIDFDFSNKKALKRNNKIFSQIFNQPIKFRYNKPTMLGQYQLNNFNAIGHDLYDLIDLISQKSHLIKILLKQEKFPRINILSYGLNYDLNINTHNKFNLNWKPYSNIIWNNIDISLNDKKNLINKSANYLHQNFEYDYWSYLDCDNYREDESETEVWDTYLLDREEHDYYEDQYMYDEDKNLIYVKGFPYWWWTGFKEKTFFSIINYGQEGNDLPKKHFIEKRLRERNEDKIKWWLNSKRFWLGIIRNMYPRWLRIPETWGIWLHENITGNDYFLIFRKFLKKIFIMSENNSLKISKNNLLKVTKNNVLNAVSSQNTKKYGGYSSWWIWFQDFEAFRNYAEGQEFKYIPRIKRIVWCEPKAPMFLFISNTYIDKYFNTKILLPNLRDSNYYLHTARLGDRSMTANSVIHDIFFDPETNIHARTAEINKNFEELEERAKKNEELMKEKKKNKPKSDLFSDNAVQSNSYWNKLYGNIKDNPTFQRKLMLKLEEMGIKDYENSEVWVELYGPKKKKFMLYGDQDSIRKYIWSRSKAYRRGLNKRLFNILFLMINESRLWKNNLWVNEIIANYAWEDETKTVKFELKYKWDYGSVGWEISDTWKIVIKSWIDNFEGEWGRAKQGKILHQELKRYKFDFRKYSPQGLRGYLIDKESKTYEEYKKLDPLNFTGKVVSATGMRTEWGFRTYFRYTYEYPLKRNYKLILDKERLTLHWPLLRGKGFMRREARYVIPGYIDDNLNQDIWTGPSIGGDYKKWIPQDSAYIKLHGQKAWLAQRSSMRDMLQAYDMRAYLHKKMTLIEAQDVFLKKDVSHSFIKKYYKSLNIFHYRDYPLLFEGEHAKYRFYSLKIAKPLMLDFIEKKRYFSELGKDRKPFEKKIFRNTVLLDLLEVYKKYNKHNLGVHFEENYHRVLMKDGPFEKFWTTSEFMPEKKRREEREHLKINYDFLKTYKKRFLISKNYYKGSINIMRSSWHRKNVFDLFFNSKRISTFNSIRNARISWDMFYTKIENNTESLNLDIINKNFYGTHSNNQITHIQKNKNILFKKYYIENLVSVYQNEEKPILNYILFKIRKGELKILHKIIFQIITYNYNLILLLIIDLKEGYYAAKDFLIEILLINKTIKSLVRNFNIIYNILQIPKYYPYIIMIMSIMLYIFIYCVISTILIIILKGYLPNNLIYGIVIKKKTKDQNKWEPINEAIKFVNDIDIEDIKKQLYNLEKTSKENYLDKNLIYKDILKDIKDINEINIENIKKLKLEKKIKKLKLEKNFFDPEHRYIYSWENRYDKTYYEKKNLMEKGLQNFSKIKIYNKFEEKKNNDLKKNYLIFYKKLIFEKNLEKWENNTKFRLKDPLSWYKWYNNIILKLIRLLESFRRDKKYNHNRIVFWEDPTLDEWNKVTYVYILPKLFFNFFFVIKFIIGSIKLWNYGYWIQKWKQYIMYGSHIRVDYKSLKEHLEKEWTLEWFKSEADYGSGLYFKDMMKVSKKFEDIKKLALNPEINERNEIRFKKIGQILRLIEEEDKLKEIHKYLLNLEQIKFDRIENRFENKFINLNKKLILDVEKKDPKVWAEQEVRYKYINVIFKKKLKEEEDEYDLLKRSYTKRGRRDRDDKEKTLQILTFADQEKLRIFLKKKKSTLEYEKKLRVHNFKTQKIDLVLDAKEKKFFESIKEYNEDLEKAYLKIEEANKEDKSEDNLYERKINTLYGIFNKYYSYYRKWTTMGARMNYVLTQILMLFIGWFDNIKKMRKNEFNIQNIFKIIWIDFVKYIYKLYWEFMIIWKEHKALKKLGFSIITILKFSLLFTPIIIYSLILYIIFILFFINFITFRKTKAIIINILSKIIKLIKNNIKGLYNIYIKKSIKILKEIIYYFKFILLLINLLFRNIETGNTIFEQLYYKLYSICGKIQRNIYFIKGAFVLGYSINKDIKKGIYSIWTYIKLKYNVYIEEKKSLKIILINKKENLKTKLELILIIINIKTNIKKINLKILKYIYKYIFQPIFKWDWKTFKHKYDEYLEVSKKYENKIKDNFKLLLLLKKLKTWDLIKLIITNILKFLFLPFTYMIRYQQNKYLENYKKGIQGFRDNPMYLILNKPKKKKDWRLKLHNILMENVISRYLENLLELQNHLIDIFFMYKISEVKWTNKNYYQDFFWRKWFWYWKQYKKKILNWLIEIIKNIEESYQNFEENIETQNWTLWERCKYAYHMYNMYQHVMTRKDQQKISRDLFFYKLAKERNKLIRIYFIKGIINWITYITLNKVIYTKVSDLKPRKLKYKNLKYYIKNIKGTIHISAYIEEIPPQFWALIIIYNKYYKLLLKYVYTDPAYPKKWQENQGLEYKKDYKWRLASPEHIYDIPFFDRRFIAADINSFHYSEFLISLANEPYDPLIRWLLFILEFGMTKEDIIKEKESWTNEINNKEEVWGDISLSQLLTYSEYLDEYKYEIKEFNRLIGGVDFLKIAENTLDRDKKKHYYDKYKEVKNRIVYKNEDIIIDILKKRRLQKAKMLHKALLRNKLKTPKEAEIEQQEENLKEYFYVKKKQFFEDTLTDKYWDWQAEYDSKMPEDTYFNATDISDATFEAYAREEYSLSYCKLDDYDYLINTIVLESYDETMEEIYAFLMLEVWKVLQKILKKDNVKSVINYKHLILNEEILSRLNYTDHLVLKEKIAYDEIAKENYVEKRYERKYSKLPLEKLRINPLYSFIENNLLLFYFEVGETYTYEDKIKFNVEAIRYQRVDKFHEHSILLNLLKILSERRKTNKNIKRIFVIEKVKIKEKFDLDVGFIQNVKWTWDQWLIYNNIDTENELLNKNTVIFNERYHIWNLKRVPIRIKLPVKLDVDEEYMYKYYKDKSNYMDFFWHRSFLMAGSVTPILKQSLEWEKCKKFLEKNFDKNIQDLVIWLLSESALNQETLKIKRDYAFVFQNFMQNYAVFHKLYFVGLAHYSWDLIRYHEIWWAQEEFPYDEYFKLKQIEFLMHDPGVKRLMEKIHDIFVDKYKPINYVFFFKYQFISNYLYHIYGFLSISNIIWMLKILYYHPGEYLANHYMIFVPILLSIYFWYLRKNMDNIRDTSQGSEIYLYRYRTSKALSQLEWQKKKLALASHKQEWIENFYDKDKIEEIFHESHRFLSNERDSGWWRNHTHLDGKSKAFAYRNIKFFGSIFAVYAWSMYWKAYAWKYRNSWWIWDYYRHDKELYSKLIEEGKYAPRGFKDLEWLEDSWTRLEEGGTEYTRWYENTYRTFQRLSEKQLDIGYFDWQVERDVVMEYLWETKFTVNHIGALADSYWIYLGRLINSHLLQDLNHFRKYSTDDLIGIAINKVGRRRRRRHKLFLKKKGITEEDHYFLNNVISKDRIDLKNNISVYKNDILNILDAMEQKWRFERVEFKENYRKWRFGNRFVNKKSPYKRWFDFLDWVEYWYNYELIDKKHIYSHFLIESQIATRKFILQDIYRYRTKKNIYDEYLEKIINYKTQNLIREKEIYKDHLSSFESGKLLDIRTLLSITEKEKHYHNFCYHLIKYKLDRTIIMKKVHPEYYLKKYDVLTDAKKMQILSNQDEMEKFLLIEPEYLVDTLRRQGRYIKNINIKIDNSKIIEYKCNLLLNYWKEQKDFWILVKDFFTKIDIIEFFAILINLLMKIWG